MEGDSFPDVKRRRYRAAISSLLIGSVFLAGIGMVWNRSAPATVTLDDAARVLAAAPSELAREQALGAVAKRARELVELLKAQEQCDSPKIAKFATTYLDGIDRQLAERRR